MEPFKMSDRLGSEQDSTTTKLNYLFYLFISQYCRPMCWPKQEWIHQNVIVENNRQQCKRNKRLRKKVTLKVTKKLIRMKDVTRQTIPVIDSSRKKTIFKSI